MARRLVDLSVTLENDLPTDPPGLLPHITYQSHADTAVEAAHLYPGFDPKNFPDGVFAAAETVTLTTHNGTHLDAPWHMHPTMDGGKPSLTIDEVPLDWCYQRGAKLDFRHFPDGYKVTATDVEAELERIGHVLRPLDIIVVNTRAGEAYGQPDYLTAGCGMGAEATLYLTTRGIKVTGIDAWSWDPPLKYVAEEYARTGDASIVWEGHKTTREIGFCHMEKLSNLHTIPSTGFDIICFPAKIKRASAGWTRCVAVFEE